MWVKPNNLDDILLINYSPRLRPHNLSLRGGECSCDHTARMWPSFLKGMEIIKAGTGWVSCCMGRERALTHRLCKQPHETAVSLFDVVSLQKHMPALLSQWNTLHSTWLSTRWFYFRFWGKRAEAAVVGTVPSAQGRTQSLVHSGRKEDLPPILFITFLEEKRERHAERPGSCPLRAAYIRNCSRRLQ